MRAESAAELAFLPESEGAADDLRVARLHEIGELIRLYRALARALAGITDAELTRLASAGRAGERALGDWTRRVERLREIKQRLESDDLSLESLRPAPHAAAAAARAASVPWTLEEPRALPFLWEVLAFVLGFALASLIA